MINVVSPEQMKAAQKLKDVIASYEKERDLILIGAYEPGTDPKVDYAIDKIEEVETFLKQDVHAKITLEEAATELQDMFGADLE